MTLISSTPPREERRRVYWSRRDGGTEQLTLTVMAMIVNLKKL